MNVLVTGGAVFICSTFLRSALDAHADWQVTALDKLPYAGRMDVWAEFYRKLLGYHYRPGDEPQKIDYMKMQNVARTVYLILWDLANRATRPKVDKQLPAQLMQRAG